MTTFDHDVVIVGGGFAGVTAARELTQRGASVLLLEARDRLGGRTWTRPSELGKDLEIGGTWVHWTQPHIWAEIARYDLPLVSSPVPERGLWKVGDDIRTGPAERIFELLDAGMSQTVDRAAELLPHPFKFTPVSDELIALDHISIADKIAELDLDEEQWALVEGMWGLNFSGYPTNGAYTQALRWAALTAGNWMLLFEACATYKLEHGTKSLLDAIASQSTADVKLNSCVTRIDHAGDGVVATLTDGSTITAREAIVTLPLNVLGTIDFGPELPHAIASIATEGQASTGVKVWARIEGDIGRVAALGPTSCALNFFQYEYTVDGDSLIVAFGADNTRIDVTDRAEVQDALRQWIPEIEVLAVDGHDWVADPLSGQTWPMLRPNQLDGVQAAAATALGHVHLAGSDYAEGWAGFIDGAIESAMKVSNRVLHALS
ncbi:putative flavin-containing monoamine oxidase AofH [Rhodococcus sp. NKCM2511]|uniref:flavin monoamine oxidase family protein n=1 Tax=Rhodococcus sp. NKCM2511 TaxID=2766011 RepID=UPI0019109883|nr:NAD(P)/FAD-dependent oxidoreductase [Rhodococcus sp. NKCM2511]MBY4403360.1 FAD-dependent oxidoreductase [Rhodococcus fascians]MBY4414727.1 FAD-dependent oxidoreductase [Rhodococcus fascians]GHP18408.1 putative flavin-containing monoamine oxidase AofH [Rhodococcus sp. NKCM2511]